MGDQLGFFIVQYFDKHDVVLSFFNVSDMMVMVIIKHVHQASLQQREKFYHFEVIKTK